MPTYEVTKKAFYDRKLIGPGTKNPTLTVDKPFPKKGRPSWLGEAIEEKVVDESSDSGLTVKELKEKLDELGIDRKGVNKKEDLQALLDADQDEQNKNAVESVSFTEAPKPSLSGPVETL